MQPSRSIVIALALASCACSGAGDNPLEGPSGGFDAGATDTGASSDGAKPDAGPAADAAKDVTQPPADSGPPKSTIACGTGTCTAPDQVCCRSGSYGSYSYACTQPSGCADLTIGCDERQNCESLGMPGTVCCGHYSAMGQTAYVTSIDCESPSTCTMPNSAIVLCDPNDATQCAQGTCTQSSYTLQGYYFCK